MELLMVAGGDSVDYEALTASPGEVMEGKGFLGAGSDEVQTGTAKDRSQRGTSEGIEGDEDVPIHLSTSSRFVEDTNGAKRVILCPPGGIYPGDNAYVGEAPENLGITPDKIAFGKQIGNVTGTFSADATATAKDIRAGKVACVRGENISGGLADKGSIYKEISAGETYIIGEGVYAEGRVVAKNLASQTSGTATAADILSGKTAWVNGSKFPGNMANRGQYQYGGMSEGGDYYAINDLPEGAYFSGGVAGAPEARCSKTDVRSFLGVSAGKIAKGQTIAGVNGTAQRSEAASWETNVTLNCTGYSNTSSQRAVSIGNPYSDWQTVILQVFPNTEYRGPVTIALSKGKDMRVPLITIKYNDSLYRNAWVSISRSSNGTIKLAPFQGNVYDSALSVHVRILAVMDQHVNCES